MSIEVLGSMILGTSLFGSGIILSLIGLLIGITRSQTNKTEIWPLIFGAYSISIAFLFQNAILGGSLLVLGILGITISYLQSHEKVSNMNIIHLAIIFACINIAGLMLSTAWTDMSSWELNDQSNSISSILGNSKNTIELQTPDHGICVPGTDCTGLLTETGDIDYTMYDIYASMLNLATYVLKIGQFVVMLPFTPWILSTKYQGFIGNQTLSYLFGIFLTTINMIILYQAYKFVTDGRGLK